MGKALIITEKPSVAREFARVLSVKGNREGYIENDKYVISWCVGHLVGMVYPESYDEKYKKWRLEDLPFLPNKYKYDVIDGVKAQYGVVHGLLHREDIDVVYWAGDAGKEGQTIEENIRNFGGVREGMKELRVWIDSQTDEELLRGINEAKDMEEYANLGKSGIMRTIEDYAMGINFSRAMSVKYGNLLNNAAGTKSYTAIAIGRVMTCVLGMVVIREREIRDFEGTPFYKVIGSFTDLGILGEFRACEGSAYFESLLLYKENGFKKKEDALELISKLENKTPKVKEIDIFTGKKNPQLLFNLAELQAECSKRFKISPEQTLAVAQTLYERKLTTYPRTDARVLTAAVAKEITRNIYGIKDFEPTKQFAKTIIDNKWFHNCNKKPYTDDSKVTDHYAIIPTGNYKAYDGLSSLEKAVYEMIVRRFLAIFYPPAEYDNLKMVTEMGGEHFFTSAKVLKSSGFLEVIGKNTSDEENENGEEVNSKEIIELARTLKVGDEISCLGMELKEGATKPPKRYTTGTMILAMENAGQLIEDEELRAQIKGSGIGTSATRAEIIAKLVRVGYLQLNTKTQVLSPRPLGEMIYEVVNLTVPALLNPKMTASWEKGLDGITNGSVEFESYREKLEDFIRKETMNIVNSDLKEVISQKILEFTDVNNGGSVPRVKIGVSCPKCGGNMVTTPFGYGCENYNKDGSGCNFSIGTIASRTLGVNEVKQLLSNGRTEVLSGFSSRAGKKFKAALVLSKDEKGQPQINFEFENEDPVELEGITCPHCGGTLLKMPYGYRCKNSMATEENETATCRFSVGSICGKKLSEDQFYDLVQKGRTDTIRGFKSKSGKSFDANLTLKKTEEGYQIAFDFENVKAKEVKDVQCPVCGKAMIEVPFGYMCEGHKKDDENSCPFVVGQISGKKLSTKQLKSLLTEGKTELIDGFESKTKKRFSAVVKLEKDENGRLRPTFDFNDREARMIDDFFCPLCHGKMMKTSFGYGCSNYDPNQEDSCRFSIGQIAGKSLSLEEAKELVTRGITGTIRGFKSKEGKRFDACLKLEKEENNNLRIVFDFDHVEAKEVKNVKCPQCGGKIIETSFGIGCANYKKEDENSCNFNIGKIAGKKLSMKQITDLLTYKKTELIEGFEGKSGKKFAAVVKLVKNDQGIYETTFDFDDKEAYYIKDLLCPKCGRPMMKTPFGFGCSGYDANDEESCKFSIGQIAGKTLSLDEAKKLVKDGVTDTIRGFKNKEGKRFDACLKLEKKEDGEVGIGFDFEHVTAKTVKGVSCPLCGGEITVTPFGYGCSNYKKGEKDSCNFTINQKIAGVKIKESMVKQLLTDGKTDLITGFKGKSGKSFDAVLVLDGDNVKFEFPDEVQPLESNILCPVCEYKLIRTKYNYECACGFKISHMVAQLDLDESIISELLENGKTKEKVCGFHSRSGNLFDAKLKYDKEAGISFDFDS
ncbi:MAG: topoisomerase C-terminal repeat-containing protein [Lachnospiraceae bacterium]|nr:topoisomerase C-terminal repeat-containing protein [Lachnospiraceae bacterium]